MLLLVLFNFLLALIFILTKKFCFTASPAFFTGLRFGIAGLFFLGISKDTWHSFILFVKQEIKWIFYIALGFAGGDIIRTQALKVIPSSHASLIATGAPCVALIISYFLLNESITRRKIAGLAIGVIGLVPLLSKKVMDTNASSVFLIAYILFIISVALIITGGIYSKKLSAKQYDLRTILAAVMLGAGIIGIGASGLSDEWNHEFFHSLIENWLSIAGFILVQNVFGFYLYNYLVKRNSVTIVTFSNLLIPLFTSMLLWWYQLETLNYEFFFAFGMLIMAFIVLMVPIPKRVHN